MYVPGPTPAPPVGKRIQALQDILRGADATLGELRAAIDGHARARRYPALAKDAARVAAVAKDAEAARQELDRLQTEAARAR